jgi:sugar-specific transcriptional regulator TrmB
MTVEAELLEDLGLTHAQSVIYLTLLQIGQTTSGPLIEKSKLQNSVVYNALHQLIEQGLVTFILQGKRKYFSAVEPQQLLLVIDSKRAQLSRAMPQLLQMQQKSRNKQEARVFTGWKGVYAAFMTIIETLPMGAEYIGFAAGFEEQFSEETQQFFGKFHKMRIDKDYKMKLIANESAREQVKKQFEVYKAYSYKKPPAYRFVPGFAPVGEIIFGDNVLEVAFGEEPIAVIIKSKQIADSHRRFFYNLWKIAKE